MSPTSPERRDVNAKYGKYGKYGPASPSPCTGVRP
ncbi:hypothetical protein FKW78_04315 [Mycolicibacterium fortuitum]|nr:hypothetical protein FKW78_04315 [Mycolicibacterium fortuitum]